VLDILQLVCHALCVVSHLVQTGVDVLPGVLHQEVLSLVDEVKDVLDALGLGDFLNDLFSPVDGIRQCIN
jgi:hypothetical protein